MASAPKLPLPRRTWLKLMATLAAMPASAQQPAPPAQPAAGRRGRGEPIPQRVNKDMAMAALATLGLQFTDPQLDMLLPVVNRQLASYEELRKINIPAETPPALLFFPVQPGSPLPIGPSTWRAPKAPALRRFKDPEELAFLPAVHLGALIRAKKITSTALTKMYLQRLKTYSPKLLCVITLTEDLALEQAKQADTDLRRGRHHSPLHGVPYGAKDLFDTKGILTTWGAEPYQNRIPDSDATVIEKLRAAGAFDDLTRSGGVDQLSGQTPGDWPNQFRSSRLIPAVEYIQAQRARTLYMQKFGEFMSQWDAFVSPTNSQSLTATNLTGHPQVVVPCGFVDGLPLGLLFTGRLYDEGTPMRLAYAYEQATDWHTKHPTLQS